MLSKAGGATVRARVAACVAACRRALLHALCAVRCARGGARTFVRSVWASFGCVCVRVQFYGNADPQNKVINEFATPVLARSAVLL